MTETDQVKILCEKAREVHRVAERRYEEIVEQAEQFGELCKVLDGVGLLLQDNENLRSEIDELEAELKEKDKKIVQLETQLNEMSKLSAGVAKKSSQDDVLKAMRTYLNISKRKTLSKREAAKTVFMDLFTSTKLDLPDDIKEMLTYLDDEQAEPKVVNVTGNYNDIHDNKAVKMKE